MLAAEDLSKIVKRKRASIKREQNKKEDNSDSDEERVALSHFKKCKDDGDLVSYEQRSWLTYLNQNYNYCNRFRWLDAHLYALCFRIQAYTQSKETQQDTGQSDFSFDGGLKVPSELWKALYKYQKTGNTNILLDLYA